MTTPERPATDWDTIQRVADKGELSRLESLSDKELDEELRGAGIDSEEADRIVREALTKAGDARSPANELGLRVVGGTGGKAPARGGRARVWAWVSGSVAATAAAAGVVVRLLAGPQGMVSAHRPPHEDARELRVEAAAACEKQAWSECEERLDEAREVDPGGEKDPRVVEERKAIAEHLH
jgi:hypothetical protein